MTHHQGLSALVMLAVTHDPETSLAHLSDADMARLFGAHSSSPGPGARLVVDIDDHRRLDESIEALLSDTAGITCSDRDAREPDFERRDTEPCGPPEDCA
jgi:hypothetical protein